MSKIRTYEDLLQEEQRLREVLKVQENRIREDLAGFRENLEPVTKVFNTVNKVFTRDNRVPFFNVGLELGIDIILRRFILARAGWFTKTFIPYLVKNYSSHIIGEEKRKLLIKKIRDMFAKIRPQESPEQAAQASGVHA
ncbi:MAG TPA: hypothetical protein VFR58_11755 [Flavisolibacter sp.]|nr:hypothetical protein [Flavisolibacter sp.]